MVGGSGNTMGFGFCSNSSSRHGESWAGIHEQIFTVWLENSWFSCNSTKRVPYRSSPKEHWPLHQIARDNLRGQKSLGPVKMSLEMAHKVIVPQKKIMFRSFLNSRTLIVILVSAIGTVITPYLLCLTYSATIYEVRLALKIWSYRYRSIPLWLST